MMNPNKNTNKERARYLVVQYIATRSVGEQEIWKTISRVFFKLYGEFIATQAGLYLVDHDPQKSAFILRVAHNCVVNVRATIATITRINRSQAMMYSVRVTGTIKAAKRIVSNLNPPDTFPEFSEDVNDENTAMDVLNG